MTGKVGRPKGCKGRSSSECVGPNCTYTKANYCRKAHNKPRTRKVKKSASKEPSLVGISPAKLSSLKHVSSIKQHVSSIKHKEDPKNVKDYLDAFVNTPPRKKSPTPKKKHRYDWFGNQLTETLSEKKVKSIF
jgi:hypothetical protein